MLYWLIVEEGDEWIPPEAEIRQMGVERHDFLLHFLVDSDQPLKATIEDALQAIEATHLGGDRWAVKGLDVANPCGDPAVMEFDETATVSVTAIVMTPEKMKNLFTTPRPLGRLDRYTRWKRKTQEESN